VITRLTSLPIREWTSLDAPIPADFLSLHFVFTHRRFNRDVPLDPEIYFFGDEVMTSLRAFTAGYRLFHPHRIVGWHAYDRSRRVPHWAEHPDWADRHGRSLSLMRRAYQREPSGQTSDAGLSVADFEDHINLSLLTP